MGVRGSALYPWQRMLVPLLVAFFAIVALTLSTDQFVSGASRVARDLKVSSVLVGAVILGCGTGLPELALAFHAEQHSPWRDLLGGAGDTAEFQLGIIALVVVLAVVLSVPALFPYALPRHSPLILIATIMFAVLLRGSLDRFEGTAMIAGFIVGLGWIIHTERRVDFDPFSPLIDDDYENHGAYIESPVMTPVQIGITRALIGLLGTAIAAQVLANSARQIVTGLGFSDIVANLVFVSIGSVLPHLVVALQALRQHHRGLAVGNLIGSNLFHSLAIGGLVAIIRPYELGGYLGLPVLAVAAFTALLTWMLLHTQDDLSRKQGIALLVAYVGLVLVAVP